MISNPEFGATPEPDPTPTSDSTPEPDTVPVSRKWLEELHEQVWLGLHRPAYSMRRATKQLMDDLRKLLGADAAESKEKKWREV